MDVSMNSDPRNNSDLKKCEICGHYVPYTIKHHLSYKDDITIEVCPRCHAKIHKSNDPAFVRYRPIDGKSNVKIGRYGIRWVKRSITIPEELYVWAKEFAEKNYWNVNHVFVVALMALKEQVDKHGYMDI